MKEFDEFEEFDNVEDQPIDIMPYVRTVLKHWKKVLLWAGIGGVLGVIIGISTPKQYTTKAVVAPELVTRATTGGLSSLASLAGINVNNMALTDAMHPDLYPVIIHSTNFYLSLFDMPVTVETRDSLVHTDLYDYIANYTKRPWWGYVFGFPMMAWGGVKNLFTHSENDPDNVEGHEHVDSLRLTRQQEMVVKALSRSVSATVEKRSYVLSLRVTLQDPVISAQLANAIIDNLKVFVVSYRTEKARENVEYFTRIHEETRLEYLKAQRAFANYMDTHQGTMNRSSMVYQQQLQNEANLRYQMYSQTAQNLMNAEAKVQQEVPVLVVVQQGIAPRTGKPSRVRLVLLWCVIGALACSVVVCLKKG